MEISYNTESTICSQLKFIQIIESIIETSALIKVPQWHNDDSCQHCCSEIKGYPKTPNSPLTPLLQSGLERRKAWAGYSPSMYTLEGTQDSLKEGFTTGSCLLNIPDLTTLTFLNKATVDLRKEKKDYTGFLQSLRAPSIPCLMWLPAHDYGENTRKITSAVSSST
ncbi:hypothetical protein WISP_01882 [Willisornis vidua]|uniref:Uncharacterized protein n=1 Tax=Willisornis vidua TaxID=1566151 RepID=A0ABQ9DJR3_9PASS|nr:hypothetical protein WISP_46590 [Willisornis vidua]KAJ7428111.1 hypothetical protein WISP_01882 [Willisornis vidua]